MKSMVFSIAAFVAVLAIVIAVVGLPPKMQKCKMCGRSYQPVQNSAGAWSETCDSRCAKDMHIQRVLRIREMTSRPLSPPRPPRP